MYPVVGLHGSLPGKAFAALRTLEGLLPSVLAKMGLQTSLHVETFIALGTLEELLAPV